MTKSSHVGTGDFPQNQNNAMSDDPADGQRKSFTAEEGKDRGTAGAPEEEEGEREERLEEFSRRDS